MPSKIRVLVFNEYGCRNGGENSWLAAAEVLAKKDVEFFVACPQNSELRECVDQLQFKSTDWNLFDETAIRKSQNEIREDIQRLILKTEPALVHANSLSTSRLVGPVTQHSNTPCVGYLRDIIKLSKQAVFDLNCCQNLVAVSNATRDFHIDQGISEDKCTVIYNGIDLDRFRPAAPKSNIKKELGLPPEERLLLCVGQIGMRKGTDTVLKAFQRIADRMQRVSLLLVGIRNSKKDEAVEFENRCRQLSAGLPVHWLARRSDTDELMKQATLLVHGARQEPLGRVLLESLGSGLPFVTTKAGGTEEILGNIDTTRLLCPVDDVDSMAKLCCGLLDNVKLHSRVSTEFRIRAKQNFDVNCCAEQTLQLYQTAIG